MWKWESVWGEGWTSLSFFTLHTTISCYFTCELRSTLWMSSWRDRLNMCSVISVLKRYQLFSPHLPVWDVFRHGFTSIEAHPQHSEYLTLVEDRFSDSVNCCSSFLIFSLRTDTGFFLNRWLKVHLFMSNYGSGKKAWACVSSLSCLKIPICQ